MGEASRYLYAAQMQTVARVVNKFLQIQLPPDENRSLPLTSSEAVSDSNAVPEQMD